MKKLILVSTILIVTITNSLGQNTNWESRGVGGGGSLFEPTISPHDQNEIFVQCDMSEVFHTTNFGADWEQVHFSELVSTGGIHKVVYTNDPNVLYTVNLNFLSDEMYPVKSTDGGQTWQPIADPTSGDTWFISADVESDQRILISSYNQLFISLDGGTTFNPVYSGGSGGLYIAGAFWDGNNIYVGTSDGLVVSDDGGASFSLDNTPGIPSGEGFLSFTGAKQSGTSQLMGTTAPLVDLYPGLKPIDVSIYGTIIEWTEGDAQWYQVINGIDANHDLFKIASSRTNNNVFYVGGTNNSNSYPVVYKTIDAGNSWSEVFLPVNNSNVATGWSGYNGDEDWWYGEIVFGLAVSPVDPDVVAYTDFGFIHTSSDGGQNWRQAYVSQDDENPSGSDTPTNKYYSSVGMENTSSWHLLWLDQDNVFASYTDITAIRSNDGGEKWSFDYNGISYNTVYHVIEDESTGTLYAAVSTVHDLYQSTYLSDSQIDGGSGAILYSTDGGDNWNMFEDMGMPVIWLAIDPNDNSTMYASVVNSSNGGIYKTNDLQNGTGAVWTQTATPARTEGHPYNVFVLDDGDVVSTWCARRAPGFTASSGVFISSNGGANWDDVSMDDEMHYWTKDICIDPNDPNQNTWYVAVHSGWGGPANNKGGLYKTIDRGQNWELVFNSYRVESATVNPTDLDEIYVTTESEGLWYTDNATSASPNFVQISEYLFQHPMRVFYNPYVNGEIWTTSFGNGLKVSEVDSIVNTTSSLSLSSKFSFYPNPAEQVLYFRGSGVENKGAVTIIFTSVDGKEVARIQKTDIENEGSLDVSFIESGIYLISVVSGSAVLTTEKVMIR